MSTKIVQNIVAFEVVNKEHKKTGGKSADIEHMHESIQRPE